MTQRQIEEEEDPDASGLFQIGYHRQDQAAGEESPAAWSGSWWRAWKGRAYQSAQDDPYLEAEVAEAPLMEENFERYCKGGHGPHRQGEAGRVWKRQSQDGQGLHGRAYGHYGSEQLLIQTAGQFPWEYTEKQELLECGYVSHLYDRVVYYLMREIEILKDQTGLPGKVKASIDKTRETIF